jgi:formylglycine-generating enzyme required for sulfatase activity
VNRGTLSPGAYTGTVTIRSGNESFAVPVKMSISANEKPVVGLNPVSSFTYNSAALSGIMVSVGSQTVTRYGFCWSVSPAPTVGDAHSDMGDCSAPVAFEGIASNLEPNTKYYVRAYAENPFGLSYSPAELSFTTRDLPAPETVPVGSVSLNQNALSRQVGDPAVTLAATVLPSNATNRDVSWHSDNTGVATVSNGSVSFTGAGTATITVATVDGNKTATCVVTVTPTASVPVPVSGVTLSQTSLSLAAGTTGQLAATVLPVNATNRNVTWSSSNAGVAAVSATGLVTAQSAGTAIITVTTQDGYKTATCLVTVTPTAPVNVPVSGVTLNQATLSLAAGATGQLAATVSPSNATNRNVTWSSSNAGVATVSAAGLVTAQSAGTATITVTTQDGYKTATCTVTVAVPPVGSGNYDMVAVGGGTFTMGCTSEQGDDCYDTEKPAHQVTLSAFYIGKYEVTQAQWTSVMGSNPSYFKGDNLPVEMVSWSDVQEFIQKLNAQTGKTYRLPTEAEWEYAARGGAQSQGYKYSGSNTVGDVAWYSGNSSTTHPVGQKSSNELGLYDMTGNVSEWCSDWYGYYSSSSQTNPAGPSSGSSRVLRGGSWSNYAQDVRVPVRGGGAPGARFNLGFRLASSSN